MALSSTLPSHGHRNRHDADPGERYRARVLAAFPGRVERIVLFGSRVRGDFHEDSDWDFAVYLAHEPDEDEKKRLRGIDLALGDETDEEVQSFLLGPERWEATDELACNVRDGVVIHGDAQKPMIERPVLEHARDALDKAERFAELSEETPDDRFEGMIHGAYYAMFHAARAALLAVQGRASTNHGQVVATFTRMVKRRKLGQEAIDLAATLTEAYKLRAEADYRTVVDLTQEGQALRGQMRPFLALCARLVEERTRA
jgi:predicted nucleotidyltransferase